VKKSLSKKILYSVIPFLEFRENNLSFQRKLYISFSTLGLLLVLMYFLTYTLSHFSYPYKYENKHMKIYANNDLANDRKFVIAINKAHQILEKNELYDKNYNVEISMIDSDLFYDYKSMIFSIDTVAMNSFNYISIRNSGIDKYGMEKYKYIQQEIVHEVIHTFQALKYGGWIKMGLKMPYWVKEGYARYIDENKQVVSNPKKFLSKKDNIGNNYTFYALMVKHAIEILNKSVDDLHLGKVDYTEVYNSLLKEYNIKMKK